MGLGSIIGLVKAIFFLMPFVRELFFGKAANPYSRDPKDWGEKKPAHPTIRVFFIAASCLSFFLNFYLTNRIFTIAGENVALNKELSTYRREEPAIKSSGTAVIPDYTPRVQAPMTPRTTTFSIEPTPAPPVVMPAVILPPSPPVKDNRKIAPKHTPKPTPPPPKPKPSKQDTALDRLKKLDSIE